MLATSPVRSPGSPWPRTRVRSAVSSRRHRFTLFESVLDVLFDLAVADQPEGAGDDLAVASDVEGRRQHFGAAIEIGDWITADEDGVVDALFFGERAYFFWLRILIHGYADDL